MPNHRKEFAGAIEMYTSGLSIQDIADAFGRTRQAMWVWLQRRGVKFRPQRRIGKDNHFHRGQSLKSKKIGHMVEKAVGKGILLRPKECSQCGEEVYLEGHHDDYNKPLEVRWLCRKCHFAWHRENKAIAVGH